MSTIILHDCVMFDGHSPELLDGADVLIEDREIKEISNRPLKSASAQEINLSGRFVMPGPIDAHFHAYAAHVNLASLDDWPMSLLSQHARTHLEAARQRGFTTSGMRSIEHANLIDKQKVELVTQRGAYVVPTLVTYDNLGEMRKELDLPASNIAKLKEIQTAGLTSIVLCKAAGIKLGFGTDLLGILHAQQCREFLIRHEVLSPFDILHSATVVNAETLNQQ